MFFLDLIRATAFKKRCKTQRRSDGRQKTTTGATSAAVSAVGFIVTKLTSILSTQCLYRFSPYNKWTT